MIKGLYIHIPFCDKICKYCDFAKLVATRKLKGEYVKNLIKELEHYKDKLSNVETIYIGGGTPTSLDLDLLEVILSKIVDLVNMENIREYTIEANPNDINYELVNTIKKFQVSRISLGVQTTSKRLLELVGRTHNKNDVLKALQILEGNSFANINLDFIYGLPTQTMDELTADLDFISSIMPKHISYYSLIIEPKTELAYMIDHQNLIPLDEDIVADYADLVRNKLEYMGYQHYEVSNYAVAGFESRHNLLYWNLEEYIGVGMSAASQYDNTRYINPYRISQYIKNVECEDYQLIEEDFTPQMEYILLGLRKTEGINLIEYSKRFGDGVFNLYPKLKKHLASGLLEIKGDYLLFSKRGMDLSNQVYLDII